MVVWCGAAFTRVLVEAAALVSLERVRCVRRAAAAGRRPRGSTRARRRVQPKTKLDAAPKSQGPLAAVPTHRRLASTGGRGLIASLLLLVSLRGASFDFV